MSGKEVCAQDWTPNIREVELVLGVKSRELEGNCSATNDEETDEGFLEEALAGNTETSAPLSTKKSFPDRRSLKQSARG